VVAIQMQNMVEVCLAGVKPPSKTVY